MLREKWLAGCLLSLGILSLTAFILLGHGARTMQASATVREIPIYSVETTEKKAALGINCAWDDKDIDDILRVLDEKKVKATFFLVGDWCRHYPEAAKKIADAGHELGSHSQTHPDMAKLTQEQVERQLADSRETIQEVTGQTVRLFRAPSGSYNAQVVTTARQLGWEVIQWDCDTLDWRGCKEQELIANGVKKLQKGSIFLLHAGAQHTAQALPALIDTIQADGYKLVPVGEMVLPQPYTLDHTGRQFAARPGSGA